MTQRRAAAATFLAVLAAPLLAACAAAPSGAAVAVAVPVAADRLDAIAADYLALSLEIGTHEDGYIDAYYGPAAIREAAERAPRDKAALRRAAADLRARIAVQARLIKGINARRAAFLNAQLIAADTRLQMMEGTRFRFADEAERLFAGAAYDQTAHRL